MDLSKLQNHAYLLYRISIIIHSPNCFPPHFGQVLHLESQTTSFTHREWFRLVGTTGGHLVQTSC